MVLTRSFSSISVIGLVGVNAGRLVTCVLQVSTTCKCCSGVAEMSDARACTDHCSGAQPIRALKVSCGTSLLDIGVGRLRGFASVNISKNVLSKKTIDDPR